MSTVADLLSTKGHEVFTVTPQATALAAAQLMREHRIGAVVVVEGSSIVGVFTERDLMTRVVAAERSPADTRVAEVMTSPVACAAPHTRVAECRSVMTRNRLRHLPIVEGGRLVGIVSSGDILARENHEQQETIEYLHAYMHGRT